LATILEHGLVLLPTEPQVLYEPVFAGFIQWHQETVGLDSTGASSRNDSFPTAPWWNPLILEVLEEGITAMQQRAVRKSSASTELPNLQPKPGIEHHPFTTTTPNGSSHLCKVLEDAKRDLDNSEWPGLMGLVLHSLRDKLLLPSVKIAQHLAPPLPPMIDQAASTFVGAACGAVKFTYGVLPHKPSLREISVKDIQKESLQTFDRLPERFGERDIIPLILAGVGFVSNFFLGLITNPCQKFDTFVDTINVFIAFLIYMGIDKELVQNFVTPRIETNILITARIQAYSAENRREQAAFTNDPISAEIKWNLLKESERYLRFSTAAYGTFQTGTLQVETELTTDEIVQRRRTRRIANLDIPEDQIMYLSPPSGDFATVRHFVAVDHLTKSVVLAIRGIYSASDVVTDIDASTSK
jgi:hypothetical protein